MSQDDLTLSHSSFDSTLEAAVQLELPYDGNRNLAMGKKGTASAVLALFAEEAPSQTSLLITKRTETVGSHRGQMAFPGGVAEPDDPNLERTALRETEEEVGISPTQVRTIGSLPPLWTPSGFSIQPIVGLLQCAPAESPLILNPDEVDQAFWIPLEKLLHEETYRKEWIEMGTFRVATHAYYIDGHRIWGATGAMIKNLLDRLHALG